jgi:SGNH hydrolase-like domain, acetyltransferase AlgX
MSRVRTLVAWVCLNVLYVCLSFVALEIGVRLTHAEPDQFLEADPLLGWHLIPGQSGWKVQGHEYATRIQINAEGYRDVLHAVQKPAGVFRILVLGDSNAEAMQVPLEESFSRLLEGELNRRPGVRVEVINTGVSNYGTASEFLLLRRDGVRYQPDLVLMAFYPGNNILVNSPELENTLVPVYDSDGAIQVVRPPFGKTGYLAHSKAYLYLRRLLLTRHPDLAGQLVRVGMLKAGAAARSQRSGIPTQYYVYATPDAVWQKAWAHTERLLDDVRKETERMGAELMVAILSSREEVYPEWWEEEFQTYPAMQQLQWDLDAPWRRITSICESKGIPYLALTPILRAARDGEPLHFHFDGHLTPAGHRLVARELAQSLLAHGLIGPRVSVTNLAQ